MSTPSNLAKKIETFFGQFPKQDFSKGHVLIHAGENPSAIFYLLKGTVREYDIANNGEEVVVNVFKPKAFFPMSYAVNRTPNDYFFEAADNISVRPAPLDESLEFLKDNPDVLFDLLCRVFSGTDGVLRRLAHLMGGSAQSRLIFELIITSRRTGRSEKDGYHINIKETELAARTGLTRETVNRQLHNLKAHGQVKIIQGGLVIKDLSELEQKLGTGL
jgi:CRP-like cAMP-binding protein